MKTHEEQLMDIISRIDAWKDKTCQYELVPGGKTNINWKVTVDGSSYFVKVPGVGTESFIDRKNCHEANLIAQKESIGPEVFHFFPDSGVEIFSWIHDCVPMKFGDVFDANKFYKMIDTAKKFHNHAQLAMPLQQTAFEQTKNMLQMSRELGGYIPYEIDRMEWLFKNIEDAIYTAGIDYVPCHNDLWSANFMWVEENQQVYLIDYEYASMNDAWYDFGIWSAVNYFTEAMQMELVKYYCGEFDEEKFARMKLYQILQDIKWAMWSCVQAVNSPVSTFDYFEWLGSKMARLRSFWSDPRIDYWLNLLKGKPIF
jgi:thiamine kinase-like enzyme